MKKDIKNNEPQERQAYVPASVEVIEVTAQRIICQSGNNEMGFEDLGDGGLHLTW